MRQKTFLISMFLAFLFAGLNGLNVFAQDVDPFLPSDDDVNAVAKELYCPVCENIPLDVCETKACEQWRELIREKLADGWSEEQIKDYFVLQYGDRVLSEPPRRGFNWLVYILPVLFFMGGVVILVITLRNSTRKQVRPETLENVVLAEDDLYLQKVEEELARRKNID